jgi:integrase
LVRLGPLRRAPHGVQLEHKKPLSLSGRRVYEGSIAIVHRLSPAPYWGPCWRCRRPYKRRIVKDSEYVFPSTTGTPTNSSNLMYRSFKPTLERAGLPRIRFHDLRHTCATIRFMKGQHPKRVQELLGHASIAMTMDIYSHVIPGRGDDNGIMDDL